jgi:tRNA(Ile)-lysidine synthase
VGIPAQNDKIIRPLLFFKRRNRKLCNENDIKWREDSSNASDKYLQISRDLVPLLKELNPYFISLVSKTQSFTGITSHG